ncbi:MAG: hypothetical protein ACE5EG_05160 [Thermoanaerobaculia bacterium]
MFSVEHRCVPSPSQLALAPALACVLSVAAPVDAAQPGDCGAEPAISVSEVAGSRYKRFEGRICARGTPAQLVQLFHLDNSFTDWLYRCEHAKTLTVLGAGHRIFYFRWDGPLFFPDQEILAEAIMKRSADGESVRVSLTNVSAEDSRLFRLQIPRHRGSVRPRLLDAEWSFTKISARRLEIGYRLWLVPAGFAPSAAANAVTGTSVRKSLRDLKRTLESDRLDSIGTELLDSLPLAPDVPGRKEG